MPHNGAASVPVPPVTPLPPPVASDATSLVRDLHPKAKAVVLVTDNLNVHDPGSLHEAFGPARARRIVEKLEWHYIPKHRSWLNVAECELAALSSSA